MGQYRNKRPKNKKTQTKPVSKTELKSDEGINSFAPANHPYGEEDTSDPKAPLPANPKPAESHKMRKKQTTYCKPDATPTWQIGLQLLTFACACIAAILYYLQFGAMVDANRISRDTFQRGQRAWVMISSIAVSPPGSNVKDAKTVPIEADTTFTVPIVIKNDGLSPALHLTMHEDQTTTGVCDMARRVRSPYKTEMTLGPGEVSSNGNVYGTFPAPCVNELETGQSIYILHGVIEYDDIFGDRHHTWFCAQYEGKTSKGMTGCPTGNNAD